MESSTIPQAEGERDEIVHARTFQKQPQHY